MKFRKKILLEERDYHSPDGVVNINRNKLAQYEKNFQDIRSKGFKIPVQFGHSDDPNDAVPIKPLKGKRLPKNNVGWLTGFKVDPDGGAEIELDIRKAADAEQVKHNLAEVSPVLREKLTLKTGGGQKFENVIGACDLVLYPVDNTQTDFEAVGAIACSLRMFENGKGKTYRLAEEEMDEETTQETEAEETSVSDESGRLSKVMEALAMLNVVLSDDTNEENFLEHLEQALLTLAAQDTTAEPMADTEPEVAAFSLDTPQAKFIDKQHRSQYLDKLAQAVKHGQITPHEADERKKRASQVRLSLDSEGNHIPTTDEVWLEARLSTPRGTMWDDATRTRMSKFVDTDHPVDANGGRLTKEQALAELAKFKRQ